MTIFLSEGISKAPLDLSCMSFCCEEKKTKHRGESGPAPFTKTAIQTCKRIELKRKPKSLRSISISQPFSCA